MSLFGTNIQQILLCGSLVLLIIVCVSLNNCASPLNMVRKLIVPYSVNAYSEQPRISIVYSKWKNLDKKHKQIKYPMF